MKRYMWVIVAVVAVLFAFKSGLAQKLGMVGGQGIKSPTA